MGPNGPKTARGPPPSGFNPPPDTVFSAIRIGPAKTGQIGIPKPLEDIAALVVLSEVQTHGLLFLGNPQPEHCVDCG